MPDTDREAKTVIGVVCHVVITGNHREETVLAKIDTGASRTSVDVDLAAQVGLGPVTDTVKIRAASSNHTEVRPLVQARVRLADQWFELPVNITDRKDMKYPVIIGMDILTKGRFLIDASPEEPED
jgi:hypothetical protein